MEESKAENQVASGASTVIHIPPEISSTSSSASLQSVQESVSNPLTEEEMVQVRLLETQENDEEEGEEEESEETHSTSSANPNNNNNANSAWASLVPNGSSLWKRFVSYEGIWFLCVNIGLIAALIVDKDNECSGNHLKKWTLLMTILQFLMMIANTGVQKLMPANNSNPTNRRLQLAAVVYIITRLLNIFWVIWAIVGITWTFQSKECSHSISSIYIICFVLSIWHCILLGVPILLCCCSIPIFTMIYLLCPDAFGRKPPRSASNRLIRKTTVSKKYHSGIVPQEDASCAICLSEYEKGDELRFLRCEHHFHSTCIVQWLKKNKSCPFCKKDIDEKEQAEKEKSKAASTSQSEDQEDGEQEEEVELVRRSQNQTAIPV